MLGLMSKFLLIAFHVRVGLHKLGKNRRHGLPFRLARGFEPFVEPGRDFCVEAFGRLLIPGLSLQKFVSEAFGAPCGLPLLFLLLLLTPLLACFECILTHLLQRSIVGGRERLW